MKILALLISNLFFLVNIFSQAPRITSFASASGAPGSTVTINGTNFSPIAANNIVFFGSVRAQITNASSTSLSVTVPNGASYQPVAVTSNGLTAYSTVPFNVTYPSELALARSSLVFNDNYSSGQGPIRILTCDLNNDGKPDLANINDTSNTVSFFRNTSTTGNISFASKTDLNTGNRPRGIAAGDIDGDGSPDIVVGNANSNTISVYRNTSVTQGAISFASKLDFNTNTDPRGVVIADIDNDGKPDIVAVTYTGGTVSILRNTSSGSNISFAPRVDLELIWATTAIAAADLNLDGNVDLIVPNGDNKPIAFFKNKSTPGNISFDLIKTGPQAYNSGYVPTNIISGDVDNDGRPDVVVTGNQTFVFQNTSVTGADISFTVAQTFNSSTSLPSLAMAAINHDAKPDLLRTNEQSQGSILINSNNSSAGNAAFDYSSPFYNSQVLHAGIAAADFDADGRVDIATANWYNRTIAVYKNIASDVGLNSFVAGYNPSSTGDLITLYGKNLTRVESVSFGGILADSFRIVDSSSILAFVGAGSSGNVTINSATGSASLPGFVFAPPPILSSFTPTIAGAGDTITLSGTKFQTAHTVLFGYVPAKSFTVINDSTIVAVVDTGGASGNVVIRTLKGTALKGGFTFVHAPVIYAFSPADAKPGNNITISGHSFTNATKLLIANENIQPFTIVSDSIITATINSFAGGKISITSPYGTGDIDGFYNGPVIDNLDIYTASATSNITIQGKNFGNGIAENVVRFGDAVATIVSASNNTINATVPVGSNFGPVTVAAHNLTAYSNRSFLQTFSAPAGKLFANSFLPKKQISSLYNSMSGVDAADLDADGKIDFVVSAISDGKILVYKNSSMSQNTSFTTSELSLNQGFLTYQKVLISDLNADGKPEIIAISPGDVAIFKNTSSAGNISFSPVVKFPLPSTPVAMEVADLDGNGKPEIVIATYSGFRVLENMSSTSDILFNLSSFFINISFQDLVKCFSLGDFNGDKKPDVSITMSTGQTYFYKNLSKAGKILFSYDPYVVWNAAVMTRQLTCDVDGDGKEDIFGANASNQLLVFRNISNSGSILFSPAQIIQATSYCTDLAIGDFDGNGKPDIAEISNYSYAVSVLLNQSTAGTISFSVPIKIGLPTGAYSMTVGDFDADEKPDIAVVETNVDFISIFRNRLGEILPIEFCPPVGNSKIYAGMAGSTYQWQMDTGTGFVQINDNSNYTGTTTDTLRLTNIPSSWSGWKFRCLVNNQPAESFQLSFTDTWTGMIDSQWENAANWQCGVIPDENTDVIINSGNINISQNTTIKSLTAGPTVNIHINPGVHLVILH